MSFHVLTKEGQVESWQTFYGFCLTQIALKNFLQVNLPQFLPITHLCHWFLFSFCGAECIWPCTWFDAKQGSYCKSFLNKWTLKCLSTRKSRSSCVSVGHISLTCIVTELDWAPITATTWSNPPPRNFGVLPSWHWNSCSWNSLKCAMKPGTNLLLYVDPSPIM
jgi:hypothetical protein